MAQAIRSPRFGGRPVADPRHITRSDLSDHPRRFRGRHHAATIFVVVLLAVVGFRLFPEQDVTVIFNDEAFKVSATFDPRAEGLAAASVDLRPGDRVLYAAGGGYSSVAVQRARTVQIDADGRQLSIRSRATTVAGALAEAGLELHFGDRVLLDNHPTTERAPLVAAALAAQPISPGSTPDDIYVAIVRAVPATVVIDALRVETASSAATVEGLLAELGMTVREGDLVRPGLQTPVVAGMTVRLAKGRTITVVLDGKEQSLYTLKPTVGEVMGVMGIDLATVDAVSLSLDTLVTNGMALTVSRTLRVDEQVEEPIPPATVVENDPNLAAGQVKFVNGVPGIRVSTFNVTYRNGQVTDRVKVGDGTITLAPVPNRQIRGTRPAPAPSKPMIETAGYTGPYSRSLSVTATWYNASQGAWARDDPNYGRTFSGAIVDHGICAVDKSIIPLGTKFFVPGYGWCLAADTGGFSGHVVDLGFPESAGGSPWATRDLDIYIVD